MGILDQFINSQIGAFGAVLGIHRTKPFNASRNHLFVPALAPGSIILQGPTKANYTSGGIQGATDSFWTHTIFYPGIAVAEKMRKRFSNNKNIPKDVMHLEFVEATLPVVRIGSLDEYLTDAVQQIAFIPKAMKEASLLKIAEYIYSRAGTPYDTTEILSDAFPMLQIKHNPKLHGCSSLIATGYAVGGISVVPFTVAPACASPKDIYSRLYPDGGNWGMAKWNY